ncbi:HU family DNA-binding protein [Stutzerimonas nitrititolerans]|uniref:HU family DNA-binding protein n=1 Tax=Stutzerimonas nitrititolerans TaxID=2482751 RepID=UPI0028B052E9|nr:HU family DNA-binding protein [Stutzerimonas nitrititolerans]
MSVSKKELVDTIHNELQVTGTPISKAQVAAVLERFGAAAIRALEMGFDVPLPGLGKLKPTERAARTGRNPATGEPMSIPAKRLVKFAEAKALSEALNG